jgi:hypothetical protein
MSEKERKFGLETGNEQADERVDHYATDHTQAA